MSTSRALLVGTSLVALFSLASCGHPDSGGDQGTGGTTGSAGTSGAGTAGTNGAGTAGTNGAGTAGTNGAGTAGTNGAGTAGTSGAGTAGTTGSGSAGKGGTTGTAGTTGTGGAIVDMGGQGLAKPGDMTSQSGKYLNLGDMRLINNRWGSDKLGCSGTTQSVFINTDKTFGWNFNRPACGGMRADPDFPELEFGVAPFGTTSTLLTTPAYSSTTLLPIQIKNLTSASVTPTTFLTSITNASTAYWDSNIEFWISNSDPRTSTNAGVYAEIIMFLGWEANRQSATGGWPCSVTTGNTSITTAGPAMTLCHQSDTWSSGWRFFNFIVNNGPLSAYSQKMDIKAILDWIMANYSGFNTNMWLTRIEVGTEVDDTTAGQGKITNAVFEVNGTTRAPQFGQ